MSKIKSALKSIIRSAASHAPWGMREAMVDACIARDLGLLESCLNHLNFSDPRYSYLLYSHFLSNSRLVEISASGDRGIVTSSSRDTTVLKEYADTGTFAETVTTTLNEFFSHNGGTYVDIGANIGLMMIPLARNPLIHCIAFEPEPVNFDLLKRNIARNAPDGSVEFHQIALYSSRTSLTLAIAEGNIGDHRLTTNGIPGRRTIEIAAQPLDDFLGTIEGPVAVKIDTQGAEPFIIDGGQQVLAKTDLLVMEFCPYLMRQLGGDPEISMSLVTDFERVAVMPPSGLARPAYTDPEAAVSALRAKLASAADTDGDYLDIIAMRRTAIAQGC